jgi:two-component system sensor histidine kinase/response regulator
MLQEEANHIIVESNALNDKLLSIISHDVKAPMNSLKGLLHLYNNNALKESEFRKISSDMESSLDQSAELLDNLLRWSNMPLNDRMIQLKPIHLKKLIEDNIKPFLASVSHKKLKINIPDINQDIISDEHSIGVAFRNVFSTAIKYSNAGEPIEIYAHHDGEMITLQISNAGEPINAEEQEKIFTYQAVSKEGTFQEIGAVLGLNLAFNLLSKIGGKLTYKYKKDHLSCFIIIFPLNAAENNAD